MDAIARRYYRWRGIGFDELEVSQWVGKFRIYKCISYVDNGLVNDRRLLQFFLAEQHLCGTLGCDELELMVYRSSLETSRLKSWIYVLSNRSKDSNRDLIYITNNRQERS